MALGALPRCWAHLAGLSGGEKIYLKSSIIMEIYPALSAAIGGRDEMDCSRRLWMTYSINRIRHQSRRFGMVFIVGDVGQFFLQKYINISVVMRYTYIFNSFLCLKGRRNGWMGAGCFG